MKKKGPRQIPDFSRHPTQVSAGDRTNPPGERGTTPAPHRPAPVQPATKPHSTSMKSGRRGS